MALILHGSILLCETCMVVQENDDYARLDYHYTGPTVETWRARIDAGFERLAKTGYLASDFNSETRRGISEFSDYPCDCCETTLAGGRYRYVILSKQD